ncbi:MAG: hypothetical protein ABFS19_14440 [Thermodesulfobacteriota bacterium]
MVSRLGRLFPGLLKEGSPAASNGLTLDLHIGMPKTGTTAIQSFLYHNRETLMREQGINYPISARHWFQQVPLVKAIAEPRFEFARFNPAIASVDLDQWQEGLERSCHENNCNRVILSSEFFWAAPAMQAPLRFHKDTESNLALLEEFVAGCKNTFYRFDRVRIIVYLRRQDRWLESFFNQQIKNGFGIPQEDELLSTRIYLLYYKNIQLWCDCFGRKNVIVRPYEAALPDVIGDFCALTGISLDDSLVRSQDRVSSTNPRLSPRAIGIMRKAIGENMDKDFRELLRVVLTNTSAAIPKERWNRKYGVFSEQFHKSTLENYRQDTGQLVELYPDFSDYLTEKQPAQATVESQPGDASRGWEEKAELLLEQLMSRQPKTDRE